jgi:hypothetical protein
MLFVQYEYQNLRFPNTVTYRKGCIYSNSDRQAPWGSPKLFLQTVKIFENI